VARQFKNRRRKCDGITVGANKRAIVETPLGEFVPGGAGAQSLVRRYCRNKQPGRTDEEDARKAVMAPERGRGVSPRATFA
jgi:hypothetical protein